MSHGPKKGYDVGYGKPPKSHRFRKGQPSPNPNGRPKKKSSVLQALDELLGKDLIVSSKDGSKTSIPANEVIAKKIVNQAVSGSVETQKILIRIEQNRYPKDQIDAQNVGPSANGEGATSEQLGELTHMILSQDAAVASGLFVHTDGWLHPTPIGAPIAKLCAKLDAQQFQSAKAYKDARDACITALCDALNERAVFCLGARILGLQKSDLE